MKHAQGTLEQTPYVKNQQQSSVTATNHMNCM